MLPLLRDVLHNCISDKYTQQETQPSCDSPDIRIIYVLSYNVAVFHLPLQKITVLNVNDYCSGESGAQPASTNPSHRLKRQTLGLYEMITVHTELYLKQQSEVGSSIHPVIEHLPIMPRGSPSLFFFQLMLL